jgi:hypothetical protein
MSSSSFFRLRYQRATLLTHSVLVYKTPVTSDTFVHHYVLPSFILAEHGAARPVLYSHLLQVVILTMCHDLALNNGCHSLWSCRLSCNVVTINVDCLLPESEVTRLRLYCVTGRASWRQIQVLPPLFLADDRDCASIIWHSIFIFCGTDWKLYMLCYVLRFLLQGNGYRGKW